MGGASLEGVVVVSGVLLGILSASVVVGLKGFFLGGESCTVLRWPSAAIFRTGEQTGRLVPPSSTSVASGGRLSLGSSAKVSSLSPFFSKNSLIFLVFLLLFMFSTVLLCTSVLLNF